MWSMTWDLQKYYKIYNMRITKIYHQLQITKVRNIIKVIFIVTSNYKSYGDH